MAYADGCFCASRGYVAAFMLMPSFWETESHFITAAAAASSHQARTSHARHNIFGKLGREGSQSDPHIQQHI